MMTAETASVQKDVEPARHEGSPTAPEAALSEGHAAVAAEWLNHELLARPANAGVRTLAMRRAQQAYGNRYVQRMVSQAVSGVIPSRIVQRQCACGGTCAACKRTLFPPGGQPLVARVRNPMESAFGADLSDVRVHADWQAAASAESVNADAYTSGRDIYFATGRYQPETPEGKKLLAHELTHTIQQRQASSTPNHGEASLHISRPSDPEEREADAAADAVSSGRSVSISTGSSGQTVARQETSPTPGSAPATVPRDALDPANTAAWDWFGKLEEHRADPSFLHTVGAAPGAAGSLTKKLATASAPQTDEEREAFEKQVVTLIRLNAVAMVGAHRNELAERKQQFLAMAAKPPAETHPPNLPENSANLAAADTAAAIRAAAASISKLNADKEQLEGLRDDIDAAVRINSGPEAVDEEYQTLWEKAQPNSTPATLQQLLETRNRMSGLFWGKQKSLLLDLRNVLHALRARQIQGIELSLALIYNNFPFFADLPAAYVTTGKKPSNQKAAAFGLGLASVTMPALAPLAAYLGVQVFKKTTPPDDQTLLNEVQASFDRLLARTDEAIVKVGSGGINPFDLPGAVAATRNSLPAALRPQLDRLQQEHEALKFAVDMILVLGIAVLTGISGGAAGIGLAALAAGSGAAAAGLGLAQLGMQLKEMLDRQTLGAASTSPEGTLLGVSAPSMFEWAMFGVGAVLTAADLAAVAKEISALRPRFNQEPHLPPGRAEPKAGIKTEGEPAGLHEPPAPADVPTGPGKVQSSNPAESRILEAGRGEGVPSLEQIDSEMGIVERTEPRKIPGQEYVEEVELPNGHTWRRTPDGNWCRFSDGRICVPRGRGGRAKATIASENDIDRLIEPARPKLETPPASVRTPEDQAMWELYNQYFAERVASMRSDIRATGQTKRDLPRDFDSFRTHYTENPELLQALRGKLAQGETGNIINDIASGKVAQNLGISKVADPGVGQVVYPDFVWSGRDGFTAVTSKSRVFRENMSTEEVRKVVMGDVAEGLEKYYGTRYVRRPGLELTGKQIKIGEVVLNYDPRLVPASLRDEIQAIARAYEGVNVKIGFFEFR
jgi:hypothetical protein